MSADYAHKETDKILAQVERKLAKEYAQAYSESRAKLDKHLKQFKEVDEDMREKLEAGEITLKQYKKWRRGKIATGRRYSALVDVLAQDMHNVNVIAAGIIKGELDGVFALNANYAQYDIEGQLDTSLSFILYDKNTVAELVKNDSSLLPDPSPDAVIDVRWNKQKIRSAILQGVLQGDPINKIADRLHNTVGMNKSSAVRNARTAMTGAQNAGRQEAYGRAEKMGLPIKKCWVATKDGRTRHEHGAADGQTVGLTEPFIIGGYKMQYPGEPSAPGHLVYNCRCTTRTVESDGIEAEERKMRAAGNVRPIKSMTYEEWAKKKGIRW